MCGIQYGRSGPPSNGNIWEVIEMYLKENHNIFYEVLYTTILIERNDDFIQYADIRKQPYTAPEIINNANNTVLDMGLYTEHIKLCFKKLSSDKSWADFNNFIKYYCHDLHKLKFINSTQAGFYEAKTTITIQDEIAE